MAPIRPVLTSSPAKNRSTLSLASSRRRSIAPPRHYTFAPNVTPISYPIEPSSPSSSASHSRASPQPDGININNSMGSSAGEEASPSPSNDTSELPGQSKPRRRTNRKDSVDHIPRPPNAFMLFRQNFVHQKHVPGSIETNDNSLSKIVGNCWRALSVKDKKVWNSLAERAKEDHKRKYPHYRFQPKHDPEKKKKRQAAKMAAEKAERERLMREERERQGLPPMPEEQPFDSNAASTSARTLDTYDAEQERERAMALRRQQVRARNILGHRRSSSVPLPSEAYPGYPLPYSNFGPAHADPFNFANPAIANAPLTNGIAIPTLPSGLGGMSGLTNQWMNNTNVNSDQNSHLGFTQPPLSHTQHQLTISRSASPGLNLNINAVPGNNGFGNFSGMSSMGLPGLGSGTMGMRAARQLQLGQLGRRASSTQPVLQHQLNSGAFNFNFAAQSQNSSSNFPNTSYGQFTQQQFGNDFGNVGQNDVSFDGFLGAVAEGFTNPFASATADASQTGNTASPHSAPNSASVYTPSIPPNANWYDCESVDPMTPISSINPQSSVSAPHATVNNNTSSLLNPAFSFGNGSASSSPSAVPNEISVSPNQQSPKSASAPQSSVNSSFMFNNNTNGYVDHSHLHQPGLGSAPGTGMRDSFDFTAFMSSLPNQSQLGHTQHDTLNQGHGHTPDQAQDHYARNGAMYPPNTQSNGVMIAQPMPVRRVELPCVAEVPLTANTHPTENAMGTMTTNSESSGCASPTGVYTPVQTQSYEGLQKVDQHQHQQEQQHVAVSDLPANAPVQSTSYSQHQHELNGVDYEYSTDYSGYNDLYDPNSNVAGLYASEPVHGNDGVNQINMGQNLGYDGYDVAQYGDSSHQQIHGTQEQSIDGQQQIPSAEGVGVEPRFSFSDYLNVNVTGSPYLSSTVVN